jgi:hypothetical protein
LDNLDPFTLIFSTTPVGQSERTAAPLRTTKSPFSPSQGVGGF